MKKRTCALLAALVLLLSMMSTAFAAMNYTPVDESTPLSEEALQEILETNARIEAEPYVYRPGAVQNSVSVRAVQQEEKYYCGPACAVMAARAIGLGTYSQDEMADLLGTTRKGTSSDNICAVLNQLLKEDGRSERYQLTNSNVSGLWSSIKDSIDNGFPLIVNVSEMPKYTVEGHFIIVTGYYYYDPTSGISLDSDDERAASDETIIDITYIDPHWDDSYYGRYTMSIDDLYTASQTSGAQKFLRLK